MKHFVALAGKKSAQIVAEGFLYHLASAWLITKDFIKFHLWFNQGLVNKSCIVLYQYVILKVFPLLAYSRSIC